MGTKRDELERMVEVWLQANRRAEAEGDWKKHLGPLYTEDAEYIWNIGPNEEFVARGQKEIEDWALDYQMQGFEGWSYPYENVLIDEKKEEVVAFWRQVAPVSRTDGTPYQVSGTGGSWFRYGGDQKWSAQRDFFDFRNVMSLFLELAADGHLSPAVKRKIQQVAWGKALPGHRPIRAGGTNFGRKLKGQLALARIAVLGR
jgi:hypothetical protein